MPFLLRNAGLNASSEWKSVGTARETDNWQPSLYNTEARDNRMVAGSLRSGPLRGASGWAGGKSGAAEQGGG